MGIFSDEKYRPSESRILATALTFSAGFIDAYTYIQRGHTLSAGQTGNVIFFASAFADHILFICLGVGFVPKNVPNYYVVPVIAFGLAVQNASFSKIEGMGYNNAFTTGNLKKSVVAWSAYFFW